MYRELWKERTTNGQAFSRAGGRRRYNARRKFEAATRQVMLLRMCGQGYVRLFLERGIQARMAEEFGVNKATISRDVKLIHRVFTDLASEPSSGRFLPPSFGEILKALEDATGFARMKQKLLQESRGGVG